MTRVKIGAAAQLAGISRSTMHRALKAGRVSFETDERGERWLDPSEIARAFSDTARTEPRPVAWNAATRPHEPPVVREIALLRDRLADKDAVIDDLRRRLDQEAEERRRLTLMLTDRRPWWRRWRER